MNCKDFHEIVDSYLSDELLTETNHNMIRHMEACSDCRTLIEARREIRTRLKTAVTSSSRFALPEGFDHRLMTQLRHEFQTPGPSRASWFGLRLIAAAGVMVVTAVVGIILFGNLNQPGPPDYMVSGFSADSLMNIATGDHQHCAIEHDLEESPIALADAEAKYQGLGDLVRDKLGASLPDHKLVEAHACKFRDVRFAHFVMKQQSSTVSILVAGVESGSEALDGRLRDFSSPAYEVSTFDAAGESVFVISDEGRETNRKAAEALASPLVEHFTLQKSEFQTARLLNTAHPQPLHAYAAGL